MLVAVSVVVLGCASAATPVLPATPAPKPPDEILTTTRLPSGTEDSANLATHPSVTTVLIGLVDEKVGEETLLLEGG